MKTLLIGIGAAGNKAVMEATESGIVKVEDSC
jgi:cell division GTPase FtsZ